MSRSSHLAFEARIWGLQLFPTEACGWSDGIRSSNTPSHPWGRLRASRIEPEYPLLPRRSIPSSKAVSASSWLAVLSVPRAPARTDGKSRDAASHTDTTTAGDDDGSVVEWIVDVRQPVVGTLGGLVDRVFLNRPGWAGD
jgi:hypothetical protein